MPANLPPDYFEAERRYKQASTTAEKIAALEDLMATVPKHATPLPDGDESFRDGLGVRCIVVDATTVIRP